MFYSIKCKSNWFILSWPESKSGCCFTHSTNTTLSRRITLIDQNATHNFHGIWIPKEVWFDKNLTWMEKLFFIEIYYLDNGEGCFASNTYFSNFFDLTPGRCSQLINSLQAKNYIKIQYQKDGKQIKKRIINIEENGIKYIKGVFNILKGGI